MEHPVSVRLSLAVLCAAIVFLFTTAARAKDVIKPDSVEGQNIRTAEDLIRKGGNTALADNIESFLTGGSFYVGDLEGKAGLTSALNNITLDPSVVKPINAPLASQHGEDAFVEVVKLAATLAHEKKHAHQSVVEKLWGCGDWKEYDAWTTEIFEIDDLIKYLDGEATKTPTKENKDKLRVTVKVKKDTLGEFIDDNKCFGYPCDAYEKLRGAISGLLDVLIAAGPAKPGAPSVGSLVDNVQKAEPPAPGAPSGDPSPLVCRATPTHRVTSCAACEAKADALNAASDALAGAGEVGAAKLAELGADVDRLSKELDDCEAHCAPKTTPQVGLAPTPTPSHSTTGGDTGIAIGVRVGVALPFGDAVSGDSLGDGVAAGIPFLVEGGYRFARNVVVGAYFGWGPLIEKNCPSGVSCSAWDMRFGVEGEYHFHTTPTIDPWAGIATGYEILSGSSSAGNTSSSSSLSGFEFVTFQGGAGYVATPAIAVGPFLGFSLGQYASQSLSGTGFPSSSGSIANTALHEWLTIGARGTYDVPLM